MKSFVARIFGRSESTGLVCEAEICVRLEACAVTTLMMFCPGTTAVNGAA